MHSSLPPELINEIISHLFATFTRPTRIPAAQTTFDLISQVNHEVHSQAWRELFHLFPLVNSRYQVWYFTEVAKRNLDKVRGLRFIHQVEDDQHLSRQESAQFLNEVLRLCPNLKVLDVEFGYYYTPGIPFIWPPPTTLPQPRLIDLVRAYFDFGDGSQKEEEGIFGREGWPKEVMRVTPALKHLELGHHGALAGGDRSLSEALEGATNLVSLSVTGSTTGSISPSLAGKLHTLHMGTAFFFQMTYSSYLPNAQDTNFEIFTSLKRIHVILEESLSSGISTQFTAFCSIFRALPNPLEVLRITDTHSGGGYKQLLNAVLRSRTTWDWANIASLAELRRLELSDGNLGQGEEMLSWTRQYLGEKGREEIEVAYVESGATFGGW